MRKRILSLVMILAIVIGCVPIMAYAETSGQCGDNLTWILDDEGLLTIKGKGRMNNFNYSKTPWDYRSVKQIHIDNGVTSIGDYAFLDCYNIENIELPISISKIGMGAFSGCVNLKSIVIPNGVMYIEPWTFKYCKNLCSVHIPETVTDIGYSAFWGCESLENINVDEDSLYLYSEDNVLFGKQNKNLILYPNGKKDSSYTIPNDIIKINKNAFDNCHNLTKVIISESVQSIEDNIFSNCDNIMEIFVDEKNLNFISLDGVLYSKDKSNYILSA